ncbi:hypothetical protein C8R47DRAFT_657709 [Mycena vitilis]|nr:hypothetical protein C8R47DRAFT_657709 [Mycena vitilis]
MDFVRARVPVLLPSLFPFTFVLFSFLCPLSPHSVPLPSPHIQAACIPLACLPFSPALLFEVLSCPFPYLPTVRLFPRYPLCPRAHVDLPATWLSTTTLRPSGESSAPSLRHANGMAIRFGAGEGLLCSSVWSQGVAGAPPAAPRPT